MAGGKFISMNKKRPGAYINFETSATNRITIGSRGIATMVAPLSWGKQQDLIELTGEDLLNGNSLAKIGLVAEDADALLFNLALQNCNVLKIFNANSGGVKATATLGENGLIVTAKYEGTFGNKIAMVIRELDNSQFSVETYADGYAVDTQKVSTADELVANDYVTFGTGTLAATTSTLLQGGTDGSASSATYLPVYFEKLKLTKWNTMAFNSTTATDITSVINFIRTMREDEGKYVQAVVANAADADYEGIINNVNGIVTKDGTTISAADFTAWVAGATAGADITISNTGKVVEVADSIVGLLSNDAIITGLDNGKFILSLSQDGNVKVEKDINSLHTYTSEKDYVFSKNRVIRELDEIGSAIESIWENTYLGKVSNDDNGRMLFKSSIINYLSDLQNRGAIQDFDSASVEVIAGQDIDSVIANIAIKPVDSMEFLYMTVNVEQ
jgi:hypothetical protein